LCGKTEEEKERERERKRERERERERADKKKKKNLNAVWPAAIQEGRQLEAAAAFPAMFFTVCVSMICCLLP
jgi:hypothetical protein